MLSKIATSYSYELANVRKTLKLTKKINRNYHFIYYALSLVCLLFNKMLILLHCIKRKFDEFKIKQNFPLKYFYGESANAIKIQIWVNLIANLLLMVMHKRLTRN